jgi:hypothetical protein
MLYYSIQNCDKVSYQCVCPNSEIIIEHIRSEKSDQFLPQAVSVVIGLHAPEPNPDNDFG